MRVSGFSASGMDTEEMVNSLMRVERVPIERLEQSKQLVEWRMESYRGVITDINSFRNDFFDILKPDNYMLSERVFNQISITSTNGNYVSAVGTATANIGTHTVGVQQLATFAKATSADRVTKEVSGSNSANFAQAQGKSFVLNLDGTSTTITLDSSITDLESFQGLLDRRVGQGKIEANLNGEGVLSLKPALVDGVESGVTRITLMDSSGALDSLGFDQNSVTSNGLSLNDTLGDLSEKLKQEINFTGEEEKIQFTINGVSFSFGKEVRVSDMVNQINDSNANVKISYNELTDKFEMTSKISGAGQRIEILEENSNFFAAIGILDQEGEMNIEEGKDAIALIDGQKVTRSTNTFTVMGVSYTLNKEHSDPVNEKETLSLSRDTDNVFNRIVKFVGAYNELIGKMNAKITESYDRSFQPLTKEQKDAMSDEDIEKWEENAKKGLLRNDSTLSNMLNNMRSGLFQGVSGVEISLVSIGIKTGTFEQRGQLIIDEDKLRESISNNPNQVTQLFLAGTNDSGRGQQGIARRLFSVIQDNVRTLRGTNGQKGILLERAGIEGDSSASNNFLFRQLTNFDRQIARLTDRLSQKENDHYRKFSRFESAMSSMMSQGNSLMAQLFN
jgi:flagellar hook-associated protein 2